MVSSNITVNKVCDKLEGLNICSINICGLSDRSRFVLDNYCHDSELDIVAVQESYTSDSTNYSLTGMEFISDINNSVNKGTLLYVNSKKLTITQLPQISAVSKNIDTTWGLVCGKGMRHIFGSVYLKIGYNNAVNDLLKMLKVANSLALTLKAKGVVTLGDFNARNCLWGDHLDNSYGQQLAEDLDYQSFSIMAPSTPSFLSVNGSSTIDFMIVSNSIEKHFKDIIVDPDVELYSGAPNRGHLPIITSYSGIKKEPVAIKLKVDFSSINWEQWSADLDALLSLGLKNEENLSAEELWKLIDESISKTTSSLARKKKSTIHSKPYWTPKLTEAANKLKLAKKEYSKRNTLSNKKVYDEAKESFDEMRKQECQKFILNKTKRLNSVQSQKFWREFKRLFESKTTNKIKPLKSENGNITDDTKEMEQILFNSFFGGRHLTEKGAEFDNIFYEEVNRICDEITTQDQECTFQSHGNLNKPITEAELDYHIRTYDITDKSEDNHGFHPIMMKKIGPITKTLLLKLFEKCRISGTWVWDTADVIFLNKDGKKDYSDAGSYRPISISSYIGKLFEKVFASRLEKYLEIMNLHDEDQEGFSKKRNTVRYLNHLDSDIKSQLAKKYTVICLFIDFEKAFDSVWKKGLMKKLYDAGVTGNIWRLINNFLFGRKVRLVFNDFTGVIRACLEFGLPQGSAISPILFKFYIRDLANNLPTNGQFKKYKFADDGTLRVSGKSTEECLQNLKVLCSVVHQWTLRWRMVLNCEPQKTELICFGTAEKKPGLIPQEFKIGNNTIYFVDKTKVLGLTIDCNLNYIEHGKEVKKKVLHRWVKLCKFSNRNWGFRQHITVKLLEALVSSCIQYAGIVWINWKSIMEVESVWYKIIKSAVGAVFNIRKSLAEAIVGVPSIEITNTVHTVKHFLKLNLFNIVKDPYKAFVRNHLEETSYSGLISKIKETFSFLRWKVLQDPGSFNENDLTIIEYSQLSKFTDISTEACSYTKVLMDKYTVCIWQDSIDREFQHDGFPSGPIVSTEKIKFPCKTSRKVETLTLSLFYPNNLLNAFLHHYNRTRFASPLCLCGRREQDNWHILTECPLIDSTRRTEIRSIIERTSYHGEDFEKSHLLVSWIREPQFLQLATEIACEAMKFVYTEITI